MKTVILQLEVPSGDFCCCLEEEACPNFDIEFSTPKCAIFSDEVFDDKPDLKRVLKLQNCKDLQVMTDYSAEENSSPG